MRGIENLQILRSQESLVLIQTHSALPLPPPLQKLFIIQLSCLFFSHAFYLITSSAGPIWGSTCQRTSRFNWCATSKSFCGIWLLVDEESILWYSNQRLVYTNLAVNGSKTIYVPILKLFCSFSSLLDCLRRPNITVLVGKNMYWFTLWIKV